MIGETLGHYRILGEIHRGGMSVVYRALDVRLNREVALKCLPADKVRDRAWRLRFLGEARAAATLEHPHIAVVHEVDELDGTTFLAMELLNGETLREILLRGALVTERALVLACEIAEGLAHAHEKGVVHRDLKPSNVIVTREGHAKIIDFGLAKVMAPLSNGTSEENTPFRGEFTPGLLIGSASYMSPEQARCEEVDHRSDIFSFGILLFELLTGERPFQAPSGPEVLNAIINNPPERLRSHLSAPSLDELQWILNKCLTKDPSERYQTMRDLIVDLRAAYRHETHAAIVDGSQGRMASPVTKWIAGALAALAILAVLSTLERSSTPTAIPPHAVPVTSFEGFEIDPALAPDGDSVAFSWDRGGAASSQLHVQHLGTTEIVRLTDEAFPVRHPAWAPNGREIAFLEQIGGNRYEVSVVPLSGGTPRRLAEVTASFPELDWSPDGHWLALVHRSSPASPERIHLLSTLSGAWRPLTRPQTTARGDRSPAFSPDGESLAFVRWREGSVSEIFVQALDGLEELEFPTPSEPDILFSYDGLIRDLAWAPSGEALLFSSYWRGTRALWSIPLEGGEPERLPFGEDAETLSVARSRDRIVFARQPSDTNIWRVAGPNAPQPATMNKWIASTRDDWSPAYSPNGRFIAFASDRSGTPQLWIWDSAGGDFSQIEFDGSATVPRWSPDGRDLAFAGDVHGNFDVYVASVVGGRTRKLTDHDGTDVPGGWSPDGRFIYFTSDRTGRYQIWRIPAGGGAAEQVSEAGGLLPRVSHDGRYIYYVDEVFEGVWRRSTEGGREERVLERSTYRASLTLWKGWLLYIHRDEQIGFLIESFDLETREITPLAELGREARIGKYGSMTVSPDGQWVLYPQDDGLGSDLMLVEGYFEHQNQR